MYSAPGCCCSCFPCRGQKRNDPLRRRLWEAEGWKTWTGAEPAVFWTGQRTGQRKGELPGLSGGAQAVSGGSGGSLYEKELEQRIASLLDRVEGVGKADVMVVLKSSEERVFHVDKNSRTSATEEKGEDGRTVREQELSESTVMGGGNQGPVVEKELTPEVAGIVISADGGGNASVRAEISEAMEALFGLPAHKIKVLKRVKEGV